MSDAVAKIEPAPMPAPVQSESAALISMIERAARDPNVDIDKMERLFTMHERMTAAQSKRAYLAAMAEMQPGLPIVTKRGVISQNVKDAKGNATGEQKAMTKYARWEDVNEAITPVLAKYGFSLSFRVAQPTEARVIVTGVLGHRDGHSEETAMALPIDSSGAKNNVQGWGSSVSYGKRYTCFALLNISARGEDDDGATAEMTPPPADKLAEIKRLIDETNADLGGLCAHFSVETLDDLTGKQAEKAKAMLIAKRMQMVKAAKA